MKPVKPKTPSEPEVSVTPVKPKTPSEPEVSVTPVKPKTPSVPEVPAKKANASTIVKSHITKKIKQYSKEKIKIYI
ncbi:hypothetical protein HMPREF9214_1408 [Lactobacillus iners LactinV 11V1-d]|nr:hypothetical protein HMPREF9214_1408 [Lactobacillus iners LactinV 11V1-d]